MSWSFSVNINPISAISDLTFLPTPNPIPNPKLQTFEVQYGSLGHPSCAFVSYRSSLGTVNVGAFGTSQQACLTYQPNKRFIGNYRINNGKVNFSINFNISGLYQVTFSVANYLSSSTISTNITVSNADCSLPQLTILNRAPSFFAPVEQKRTDLFTVLSTTTINCANSLSNTKKWLIYRVDPISGAIGSQVTLVNNPTIDYAEIVIQPNSLTYGLYKFIYQVSMYGGNTGIFVSQIDTFVKIVPTGIAVMSLANGVSEISRGLQQEIVLDPTTFSYDMDYLVSPKLLTFKFYCQILDAGFSRGFPLQGVNKKIDLMMFKNNLTLAMNNATSCFDDSCK